VATPRPRTSSGARSWLVAGHGSVGSFVAARLTAGGAAVSIFDPRPRVPVVHGTRVADPAGGRVDYAISCVSPEAAENVPSVVEASLSPDGVFFDWNTVAPAVKRRIAAAVAATTIDVALLDSLDADVDRPMLAVSGRGAYDAAGTLEAFGFRVFVAGGEVGQAALLKYLRSVFMKGFEALVLEYASLASHTDGAAIVRASLASNLGEPFVRFMDLLLETNRIHAERRSRELAAALALFADGVEPKLSFAAVEVLRQAAAAWSADSAPPADAGSKVLAGYLHAALWREAAST
jgi:hypothetical protein